MLSRGSLPAPFQGPPRPKPSARARAGEQLATRFPPRLSASHLFSVLFFSFGAIVLFVCFSWPDGSWTMFTLLVLLSQLPIVTFSFPHCTRGPQEARHAGEGEQTNPSYVCGSQMRKGNMSGACLFHPRHTKRDFAFDRWPIWLCCGLLYSSSMSTNLFPQGFFFFG